VSVGPVADPPDSDAAQRGEASDASSPVRRVDDRWQASWDRFQAAHDEEAARQGELSGSSSPPADPPDAQPTPPPSLEPAARPEPPAADPLAPRVPRHHHPEPTETSTPATAVSAAELTSQSLLRQRQELSTRGWRRLLNRASGGSANLGLSAAERRERDRMQRIVTPVQGCHRVAVVSLKGGVGKTTTTACLGLTLAHHRGDRVVAMDANPDSGTLAERLTGTPGRTVSDLLADLPGIRTFTDVAAYTSLAGRLQVLGSGQDPATVRTFDEARYRAADEVLARYFNILLVDSGTGLLHSAMTGTLAIAESLVVVGGPTVDGASGAAKTLDWLEANGYAELAARSVSVISHLRPDTGGVDLSLLRRHFASRSRALVELPYDPHLATGAVIVMEQLREPTVTAFVEMAAVVAEGFAPPT